MQRIYLIAVWTAVFVLVSTFASCTPKEVRDKLVEAESVMEEIPDSALHIIASVDTTDLRNRKDWAKYALLNVQARTKNNEIITSDSLISRAVTYYQEKGDSPDLMKALFYYADVLYNQGRFTLSIHWRLLKSVNAKLLNSVFMLVTRFSGLQTLSHFSNDYIGVGALKLGSPIFHECRTIHFQPDC